MTRYATPDMFYAAAMRLLAGPGLPALRIGRLCREVGVTSGSFYHHFGGWDGFVAALLAHWTDDQVERIARMVQRESDPRRRVEILERLGLAVPHEAEAAIRSWAATDEVVAAAQRRVDERRRDVLAEVFVPLVGDEALARTLAELGVSLLVGYQQRLDRDASTRSLAALFAQYAQLVQAHAVEAFDVRLSASHP